MKTQTIENRENFKKRLQGNFIPEEIDEIMFAYDLSKEAHRTHKRDSGERYFEHPRAGAIIILDELGWYDKNALIAFLLHDTGEDSPIFGSNKLTYEEFARTLKWRVGKIFDSEVVELIVLLTKPFIDNVQFKTKEESQKHYLGELQKNPKALLLKMVDRLHNLRSLKDCDFEKVEKIYKETESVYLKIFLSLANKTEWEHNNKTTTLLKKIKEKMSVIKKINEENPVLYYKNETRNNSFAGPIISYYYTSEYVKNHPFDCRSTKNIRCDKSFYDLVVKNGGTMRKCSYLKF